MMTKLEKILLYVSENNEFYKKIIKEYSITDPTNIMQYPILTRENLQKERINMFSKGVNEKYYAQKLMHQKSSGSSGIPIDIYWDPHDYNVSMLETWRMRKKLHNISPANKRVSFLYINNKPVSDPEKMYYIKNNELYICKTCMWTEANSLVICDLIDRYSPDWLYVQPSVLNKIVCYYEQNNRIPVRTIRYIECMGEVLTDSLKQRVYNLFGVQATNMYGSTEMNSIAYQVNNKMKILNNVYVEVLTPSGIQECGEGVAIITNLCNRSMPLIRYNQGDLIIKETNSVSNEGQITVVKGRIRDFININGKDYTASFFVQLCEKVNNIVSNIIVEYYFVFHRKSGVLTCYLKLKESYDLWQRRVRLIFEDYWKLYNLTFNYEIVFFDNNNLNYSANKYRLLFIEEN